jgi:hypothetical protein
MTLLMRAKILAIVSGIVLAAALLAPTLSSNVQAQVTSESRVLQAVLGLTEVVKGDSEALVDTTENIEDDLLFKKKFYELPIAPLPGNTTGFVEAVGIVITSCPLSDDSACAFNVESIQIPNQDKNTRVDAIIVDGIATDISGKELFSPTNLLVDAGIGQVGASDFVAVGGTGNEFDSFPEFNGEKPQGLELLRFFVQSAPPGILCLSGQGEIVGCPDGSEAWEKVERAFSDYA